LRNQSGSETNLRPESAKSGLKEYIIGYLTKKPTKEWKFNYGQCERKFKCGGSGSGDHHIGKAVGQNTISPKDNRRVVGALKERSSR